MTTNCLYKTRCGRCPGAHETRDCTRPFIAKGERGHDQQYCHNCGKEGHPATSVDCPVLAKEKQQKENKLTKNSNDPTPRNNRKVPAANDFEIRGRAARNVPKPVTASAEAPKWVSVQTLGQISNTKSSLLGTNYSVHVKNISWQRAASTPLRRNKYWNCHFFFPFSMAEYKVASINVSSLIALDRRVELDRRMTRQKISR